MFCEAPKGRIHSEVGAGSSCTGHGNEARTLTRPYVLIIQAIAVAVFGTGCFSTAPGGTDDVGESLKSALSSETDLSIESPGCLSPEDAERMADQVLQLVNLERAQVELPPVVMNHALARVADDYACRMIVEDFFGHTDPLTGRGPGDRAVAGKYQFYAIGENLAAGQQTPAEVMEVWMDSPPHRAIILDAMWAEVGIAVRTGGEYAIYWVQEFGSPTDF